MIEVKKQKTFEGGVELKVLVACAFAEHADNIDEDLVRMRHERF